MTILAAALRYAARGIHVVPTDRKVPLTEHGCYDASTEPDTIRAWFDEHPRASLAIATGASGLVVLDVDAKNGIDGRATLAALETRYGALPATLTASSPSGGEHRYFRAPEGVELRPATSRVGGEAAPGVDVRAGASLVTAPPSPGYGWTSRLAPAALPETWCAAITPAPRVEPGPYSPPSVRDADRTRAWCLRALQDEARALAETPDGQRNAAIWRAAAALGGLVATGGLQASEIATALEWACSTWRTRMPRKDADTIRRGVRFGIDHPRRVELEERGRRAA